jgi:predicted O-methyltransferase YrrM
MMSDLLEQQDGGAAVWAAVDDYVVRVFHPQDPVLDRALERSADAGLPNIQISPTQGALLGLIARAAGAQRILEIGTLGGYSTIFLARAIPAGGRVVTLEVDPAHAAVAGTNLEDAGLSDRVDILLGDAQQTLADLLRDGVQPFDFVFIDADKQSYVYYLEAILPLCHVGTVIVADNVVRGGKILDPGSEDPSVQGALRFNARLAAEPSLDATVLQTVGSKGHDGLAVAVVRSTRGE